eukprot:scaffold42999_cov18-Prasinocladus_malaysianus.AAC.1
MSTASSEQGRPGRGTGNLRSTRSYAKTSTWTSLHQAGWTIHRAQRHRVCKTTPPLLLSHGDAGDIQDDRLPRCQDTMDLGFKPDAESPLLENVTPYYMLCLLGHLPTPSTSGQISLRRCRCYAYLL